MTDKEPVSNPNEDKAWATIQSTLRPEKLRAFCHHLERLYRINPYSEFRVWKSSGPGEIHVEYRNLSNDQDCRLDLTMVQETENIFSVQYAQGVKSATRFEIQATDQGSSLTITDEYNRYTAEERAERLQEVDKSLPAWCQAIYEYLRRHKRWGWFAPWRWYMRWVWMPMKPSARRIVWLIYLITIAEFFFFLFVALIWWLEHRS